jgi:hypothetical protein
MKTKAYSLPTKTLCPVAKTGHSWDFRPEKAFFMAARPSPHLAK